MKLLLVAALIAGSAATSVAHAVAHDDPPPPVADEWGVRVNVTIAPSEVPCDSCVPVLPVTGVDAVGILWLGAAGLLTVALGSGLTLARRAGRAD